jgi:hypothetical protein
MDALRIGIRAIGPCRPLICAVAVETAKTHGTTQLRRINFFQFIILWVSKKLNRAKIQRYRPCRIGTVTPLLLLRLSERAINSSSKKRCEPFVGANDEFLSVFTVRVCCEKHATTRRHPEGPGLNFRVKDLTLERVTTRSTAAPDRLSCLRAS